MEINDLLERGVDKIYPSSQGLKQILQQKKITLYQGFDPSMPSLHLGNMAGLVKLRQFQKLGHKVIFLIGDFTGMIGDPTDKLATRKKLTRQQVMENSKKWKSQAEKILDFTGENPAEIRHNSEWSDEINFKDLIEISSNLTVQQLIERDMFQKRIAEKKPIYLHEFLYPLAQGYDSVVLGVDLEIGGSDQLFNMLVGRSLVKAIKDKEKYVLTTKLLVDENGNKVGKTTGNALFMDSAPEELFGGIMSFPDSVVYLAFELLTDTPLENLNKKIEDNPMSEKKRLAFTIVKTIYGEIAAKKSQDHFENTFQDKNPKYENIAKLEDNLLKTISEAANISISQSKRLINQNAIEINGETISNIEYTPKSGDKIKIGKKMFFTLK